MEKLKVALVGTGSIGRHHLKSYRNVKEVEVYALCDINEERLNKVGEEFGVERRYTDINEMLKALPELDAADICVWNCNHAKCTIAALEAGLHVMCEKPMAYNTEEAIKMKETADRMGKLLMIGFVLRFSDDVKIAKEFIDAGYIGDVYYTKAQYLRRHGNPGGWFGNKELSGGGPVIDLGVHVIDLERYLMGNPKPVSVYAATYDKLGNRGYLKNKAPYVSRDAGPKDVCDVEDLGVALIRYDNGAVTQLETSYDLNGMDSQHNQIYGTKGGVELTGGMKIFTEVNGFVADIVPMTDYYKEGCEKFEAELRHFADCILNGTECRAKAEDGIVVMKILDAIYESARTGHEVIIK